ncbi:NADPH-dependent F420 reductase [Nocardioides okcheonensis]|uniref:NADPH-dependent F420 reductase n=1 Tax=Nocardioides okcheonensis TaxID=2894081 RepID=UPI001E3D5E84|nr:NAD(P)-binding domain-containing protein [Nocardioides okcheonensis]UFN46150.1 NAD(P)-binding domain-containing protein [Nocardioides okcheonensis]
MTTLGIVGAGHIGSTVARLAVDAGVDVVIANSRGPETLADLVADLGPHARAASAEEAAADGDLVVLTVPLKALRDLPVEAFDGQVVLDTGNYYPERDGRIAALDDGSTTASELTAHTLPGARVVKVFNNIFFEHLAALARPQAPGHGDERSVLAIAGDDEAAKDAATALLDRIGYDAVDAGPLAEGWRFQPDTPAYGLPYDGSPDGQWSGATAKRVGADELRAALAAATRSA